VRTTEHQHAPAAPASILILDTGKEWGGGTNSLLELLRRASREKYRFLAVFHHNYERGGAGNIKQALEQIGVEALILPQRSPPFAAKLAKEALRALLFFSRPAARFGAFLIDYLWRIRSNARKLEHLIRLHRIDLVYLNNQPSSNLEGIIAAHHAAVPVVQHGRKTTSLNAMEGRIARAWLDKLICVSEGVREHFAQHGFPQEKCTVVHNGIDLSAAPAVTMDEMRSRFGIPPGACVIGTVGSLIPLKRVELLIEAMARLRSTVSVPLRCLIVGDGPELPRLRSLAETRGLARDCLFAGFQPDALSHISAMDIFVLASAQEGLPRTILEAMLLGKPVVASNVTGSRELVVDGETGRLFPSGDAGALADCLRGLIPDADLRARMGSRGQERVRRNFSIENYVQGVERQLDEVIAQCRTSS
jgi:glycosyltransferase involved in cell wall biosynthesis